MPTPTVVFYPVLIHGCLTPYYVASDETDKLPTGVTVGSEPEVPPGARDDSSAEARTFFDIFLCRTAEALARLVAPVMPPAPRRK
jgi:hypothetical protein